MPTSLNLLNLFSNEPSGFGPTQILDMTQPAFANTLSAYKTTHQQALIGFLSDIANSSINKDEFYNRFIFAYLTTILEAGLTPDPTNWTQQIDAIKAFAEKANIHDSTKPYKQRARVQNGLGGDWYEAVQDVPVNTLITNPLYWLPSSNFKIFNSDDVLTTGRALTANDINKHFIFNNTLPQTFNLPLVNSIPSGSVIYVRGGQAVATFNCSGDDAINVTNGSTVTSCSCFGSEAVMLVSNSGGDWRLTKINPRYQYSNLTDNRDYNTTYTNQTGFELEVFLTFNPPNASNTSVFPVVNGESILGEIHNNTISRGNISFRVPPGATYRIDVANLTSVNAWFEYVAVI